MSDTDHIVQVSYGQVELSPKTPPRRSRRDELVKWLQILRTALINLVVLVSLAALIGVTVKELFRRPVIIEEIGLPKALSDRGLTGVVTAHRLWDAILEIQDQSGTVKPKTSLVASSRQLDVVEPGTGISLQSLTQVLRALFGLRQTRISGEILCTDTECSQENLRLRLRVFSGAQMHIVSAGVIGDTPISLYFRQSAIEVLQVVDPYVVASYLSESDDTRDRAIALAERLVREDHGQSAWAANFLGNRYQEDGDQDTAITWYQRSVELGRKHGPDAWALPLNGWGNSLQRGRRYEEAIGKYAEAIKADPEYALAYNGWGNALYRLGRNDEAIEKYQLAIKYDPGRPSPWNGWGNQLAAQGLYEGAIEKYKRAIEIEPDYSYAWLNWGLRLRNLGRFEEALEKSRHVAVDLDPESASAWIGWGYSLDGLERFEEAAEKFERATRLEPDKARAWIGWGQQYRQMGDNLKAIEKYRMAARLEPDEDRAYSAWAFALSDHLAAELPQDCAKVRRLGSELFDTAGDRTPDWFRHEYEDRIARCDAE